MLVHNCNRNAYQRAVSNLNAAMDISSSRLTARSIALTQHQLTIHMRSVLHRTVMWLHPMMRSIGVRQPVSETGIKTAVRSTILRQSYQDSVASHCVPSVRVALSRHHTCVSARRRSPSPSPRRRSCTTCGCSREEDS